MSLPLALLPYLSPPFSKVDPNTGALIPNAGGKIYSYETDITTPQNLYTDSAGATAYSNPIVLDDDGWPPSTAIYVLPTGYALIITDSDGVTLHTLSFVEDVGSEFLDQSAVIQSEGTDASSSPYLVTATDNTVTVSSATNPFIVQLPAAADRGTPLIIKNLSAVSVRITPDGAETIETVAAYYTLTAASSPTFPSVILNSDGVSNWWIAASHGL
jgi:hypothetical protein